MHVLIQFLWLISGCVSWCKCRAVGGVGAGWRGSAVSRQRCRHADEALSFAALTSVPGLLTLTYLIMPGFPSPLPVFCYDLE